MINHNLTVAERLKFDLFSDGLTISAAAQAYIDEANGGRALTPADYASTSGVILELEDNVWVNAPIAEYNPNFVEAPPTVLDLEDGRLVVRGGDGVQSTASFWLPPAYHDELNDLGEAYTSYAFTHGDRVRISPIEGCAIACQFCNLPYEFRYRRKSVEGLVDSVQRAITDETQPASHVLISGGTPRVEDYEYVQEVYEAVITGFPQLHVDIMMLPAEGLLDVAWLDEIGVNELSINIEIHNRPIARRLMKRKFDQTLDYYLDFIERAAEQMGRHRVRSMLLLGIEPLEDTLAGVEAIAARGGVPVLSPFRPDPSTPMRNASPPDAAFMEEAYFRAREIAGAYGTTLGPSCIPCTHNTMTLAAEASGDASMSHGATTLV